MCFGPTLICSLLLASTALAGPLERRDTSKSYTRAGVVVERPSGTFQETTGTIAMQEIQGPPGTTISAWVGIDHDDICNNSLRAGIKFTAEPPTYTAWYEWYPDPRVYVKNFTIYGGEHVRFWVGVYDDTMSSGYVMVAKPNDTKNARNYFLQPGHTLCGGGTEWVVGDDKLYNGESSQVRISTVGFTDVVASGPGNQSYGPLDGDEIEMVNTNESSSTPLANVTLRDKDSFIVIYPGEW